MILVFNSGSSSVKVSVFDGEEKKFQFDFKNYKSNEFTIEINGREQVRLNELEYNDPFSLVLKSLIENGAIGSEQDIEKIGHRIVHGGERFTDIAELTDENIEVIESFNEFAPLHNPPALKIVNLIRQKYPEVKQFGVFDTSFHLTVPKENFLYGLPYGYYENIKIRKFGFHGISYSYIVSKTKDLPEKTIICHLGSGSSIAAVKSGKSFNHSFGFTPEGDLIMATRSGKIDYSAVMFLKKKLNLSESDITELINKESGLLGISGYTKDMKQLLEDFDSNERAKLAIDMYVNKIAETIASFVVDLGGCDLLVFTGGIGSGSDVIREMISKKLESIGLSIDYEKNRGKIDVKDELDISVESNRALVIRTNEEEYILEKLLTISS